MKNGKRIIPVVHIDVGDIQKAYDVIDELNRNIKPDDPMAERLAGRSLSIIARNNWKALEPLNWLFFREGDNPRTAFKQLIKTIRTDPRYVQTHTRLLIQAQRWKKGKRSSDLVLQPQLGR